MQQAPRVTRKMLEDALEPINGRTRTLQEISTLYGLSRERIRQRLVQEGIKKLSSRNVARCPICHKRVNRYPRVPDDKCRCYREAHAPIQLTCGVCGTDFPIRRSDYRARYLRLNSYSGLRVGLRQTPPFCSRRCNGVWLGSHRKAEMEEIKP